MLGPVNNNMSPLEQVFAMDSDSSLSELSSSDLSSIESPSPSHNGPLSPISTQDIDANHLPPGDSKKREGSAEEQPPTKKRKRPEPKPRKTDTLDLTKDLSSLATEQKDALHKLLQVLRKRRKIVVIAGAGISVSAGIPDFRSSTGLFKTLKGDHKLKASGKQLFDASVYQTDSSTSTFHDMVRQLSEQVSAARPTEFHEMLSTLALESRLLRLYTQNVDGLDTQLPFLDTHYPLQPKAPWPTTIQVHGGLEKMACSKCSAIFDFEPELFNGPDPPPCSQCLESDRIRTDQAGKRSHGIGRLRPRMALYNERTPDEDAIGAVMEADLKIRPDALIVVGTSLKIPGVRRLVREMCGVIRDRRDGLTIWMNMDPPPMGREFEDCWDLVVKGPCDAAADQWKQSHFRDQSGSDTEKETQPKATKKTVKPVSLPTPSASPSESDEDSKPRLKLHLSKHKLTTSVKLEGKKETASSIKKTKPIKPQKPRKIVSETNLASKFKVSKPGTASLKTKILTPKKAIASSPLSSPPPSSPQLPGLRTPSKSPHKRQLPSFPGLVKYSPSKHNSPSKDKRNAFKPALSSPAERSFRSSPPPHEPLSSPVFKGRATPASKLSKLSSSVQHVPSRPSSSGSNTQETVSPTSVPRGMRDLID